VQAQKHSCYNGKEKNVGSRRIDQPGLQIPEPDFRPGSEYFFFENVAEMLWQ